MHSASGKQASLNVVRGDVGFGNANAGVARSLKANVRASRELAGSVERTELSSREPEGNSNQTNGVTKSPEKNIPAKTAAEEQTAQTPSSVSSQVPALAAALAAEALSAPSTNTKQVVLTPDKADEPGQAVIGGLEGAERGAKVALFKRNESLADAHLSQTPAHGQASIDATTHAPTRNEKLQAESPESDSVAGTGLNSADGVKNQAATELPAALSARIAAGRKEPGPELTVPEATAAMATSAEGLASPAITAESRISQNNASSSIAGRHGIANGGRTPGTSSIASTRSVVTSVPTQHGSGVTGMQSPAATEENAGWALGRDISSTRGTAGSASDGALEHGSATAGTANRDTFSALDTESAARGSTWIHAGARSAEAGYQDVSLGWVGVRADLGASGIHASLVPATADAAQALGGHLAGLNAHLAERHTPVETLTLAAPENQGADAGTNSGANQDMRQGTGQGSEGGQQSGAGSETAAIQPVVPAAIGSSSGGAKDGLPMSGRAGTHISVMA